MVWVHFCCNGKCNFLKRILFWQQWWGADISAEETFVASHAKTGCMAAISLDIAHSCLDNRKLGGLT